MTETVDTQAPQDPSPITSVVGYDALCDAVQEYEGLLMISTTFQIAEEDKESFTLPKELMREDAVFDLYLIDTDDDTPFEVLHKESILPIRRLSDWQLVYLVDPGRTITSLVYQPNQNVPMPETSNSYNVLNYGITTLVRDTTLDIQDESRDTLIEEFPQLAPQFEVCQTQYRAVLDHKKTSFTVLNVDTFVPLPIRDVVCVQDPVSQVTLMLDPSKATDFTPLGEEANVDALILGDGLLLPPLEEGRELGRYYGYVTRMDKDDDTIHMLLDLVTGLRVHVADEALREMMWVPFDQALQGE